MCTSAKVQCYRTVFEVGFDGAANQVESFGRRITLNPLLALFYPAAIPAQIIGDLQRANLGIEHPALTGVGLGIRRDMMIGQTPDLMISDGQFLRQRLAIA